jgi:tRNA dimethylallyltransferase
MTNKIILISGPTATGKSSLAKNIAEKIDCEIINADSIQLYKDLSILTARPLVEKEKTKHHLYGLLTGDIKWSVGKWVDETKALIENIIEKGKTPIIVGGTGLYFKAITDGLSPIPDIDYLVREELNDLLLKNGLESLYLDLQKVDPVAAEKINPNDRQRVMRALEVYRGTRKRISDYWKMKRVKYIDKPTINFSIEANREWIYERCDLRIDNMLSDGVIDEVENLQKKNYSKDSPILKAIGVEEILSFLKEKISIEEASDLIKFKTHQYAKRQITWINNQMITWNKINTQYSDKNVVEIIKKL